MTIANLVFVKYFTVVFFIQTTGTPLVLSELPAGKTATAHNESKVKETDVKVRY